MGSKLSHDEKFMISFAFRYALGRATMSGLIVTKYILKHINQFTEQERMQFVKETEQQLRAWEYSKKDLIMDCDIELWTNFAKQLRGEHDK